MLSAFYTGWFIFIALSQPLVLFSPQVEFLLEIPKP